MGISALVALMIISLSVWLLRKRAREETAPDTTPEHEEGAEATHREELEARKRSGYHLALQAQKEPHQGRRHLQARNAPRGVGKLLHRRHLPEKNRRQARSDLEGAKRKG